MFLRNIQLANVNRHWLFLSAFIFLKKQRQWLHALNNAAFRYIQVQQIRHLKLLRIETRKYILAYKLKRDILVLQRREKTTAKLRHTNSLTTVQLWVKLEQEELQLEGKAHAKFGTFVWPLCQLFPVLDFFLNTWALFYNTDRVLNTFAAEKFYSHLAGKHHIQTSMKQL